jgi:hypothetical protein
VDHRTSPEGFRTAGRYLALFLVIAFAAYGGVWAARWIQRDAERPSEPVAEREQTLDLGTLWEQVDSPFHLAIHNPTDRVVRIVQFSSSCSCASIEPRAFVLEPRSAQAITVTLNLTQRTRSIGRPADFSMELIPITSDAKRFGRWLVRATVKSPIGHEFSSVEMGTRTDREPPTVKEQTLDLAPEVADLEARSADPRIKAEWNDKEAEPGKRRLRLISQCGDEAVNLETRILLTPRDQSGKTLPTVRLPVRVTQHADLEVLPAELALGPHPVGAEITEQVTLRSRSKARFVVERTEIQGEGLQVQSLSSPNEHIYELKQRVTQPGAISTRVRFHLRYDDGTKRI